MAKKLTTPQVKALRLCAVDQFGQYGGQHVDGMVTKALRTRGFIDSAGITDAGRLALAEVDGTPVMVRLSDAAPQSATIVSSEMIRRDSFLVACGYSEVYWVYMVRMDRSGRVYRVQNGDVTVR